MQIPFGYFYFLAATSEIQRPYNETSKTNSLYNASDPIEI